MTPEEMRDILNELGEQLARNHRPLDDVDEAMKTADEIFTMLRSLREIVELGPQGAMTFHALLAMTPPDKLRSLVTLLIGMVGPEDIENAYRSIEVSAQNGELEKSFRTLRDMGIE